MSLWIAKGKKTPKKELLQVRPEAALPSLMLDGPLASYIV
jgi:hypothetical protein